MMTTSENPQDETQTPEPHERRPFLPSDNRFLFVDVAAQRAKQLRRGALPRLDAAERATPYKLERIAMEEVMLGIIPYELPAAKPEVVEGAA